VSKLFEWALKGSQKYHKSILNRAFHRFEQEKYGLVVWFRLQTAFDIAPASSSLKNDAWIKTDQKMTQRSRFLSLNLWHILYYLNGLFYQKGSDVWGKDGCIDDQEEDNPIPERFERRVVQNGPFVDSRRLQFVLGHHLSSQR
jgi:hypothetical protein